MSDKTNIRRRRLTPGILDGHKHVETFEFEVDDTLFEVEVRPLRHSEAKRVQRLLASGVRFMSSERRAQHGDAEVEIDAPTMAVAKYEAQLLAAALGTVDEAWTEETIDAEWPSEWIADLGSHVMEISGVGEPGVEGKGDGES